MSKFITDKTFLKYQKYLHLLHSFKVIGKIGLQENEFKKCKINF